MQVITDYFRRRYDPTFRRMKHLVNVLSRISRAPKRARGDDEIIPALYAAEDFPRDQRAETKCDPVSVPKLGTYCLGRSDCGIARRS